MNKKQLIILGLMLWAVACWGQIRDSAYRVMLRGLLKHSVPEIGVRAAARDSASIVFLDAREPAEYAVSHIKNAVLVGYDQFDLTKLPALDPQSRIVVYCSVGYRSEKIAEKLKEAGFSNVSNLYGGIFEWVNQSRPVYNDQGPTTAVHAYDRSWGIWLHKGKKVYGNR